jgi:hypothetical protein
MMKVKCAKYILRIKNKRVGWRVGVWISVEKKTYDIIKKW